MEEYKNKIIQGDTLAVLKSLPDECVDCIVTSPPYYGLRDYGNQTKVVWGGDEKCEHKWISKKIWHGDRGKGTHKEVFVDLKEVSSTHAFCSKCGAWFGQLGLEPTLEMYLENMLLITGELKRVLKKTGTMWWNHGDCYSASRWTGSGCGQAMNKFKDGYRDINPQKGTGLDDKTLVLQNYRLVVDMVYKQGWYLRNQIVWWKPNCMPSSSKDRFTVDFEPIFFFSKSKKYWFETQLEKSLDTTWKPFNLRVRDVKAGKIKSSQYKAKYDEVKNYGGGGTSFKGHSGYIKADGTSMYSGKRNKRCVWKIPTHPFKDAHFATFPEKLIEPMIKAGCPPQGIVLDPFMGSGTTAYIARKLGRNYLGIELNENYIKMAEKRLSQGVLV